MARPEAGEEGAAGGLVLALRRLGGVLQRIPRGWAALAALGWAGLIAFLSSRPPPSIGAGGGLAEVLSNLAHAPEYGGLVVWLALAVPRRDGWPDLAPRTVAAILGAVAAYAVVDEIRQAFTPHRDPSAFDVLTDLVGASATLACIVAAGTRALPSRRILARIVLGILACAAAATLATFVPKLFPDAAWL